MIQKNYNENLVAGAAIRDDKGRRISKLFESTHPKMTVGYANNLIIPNDPIEQEFNFRQSVGGVIEDGVAVIDKVKGNSVVWNQLVQNGNFASTEEWVENGATISISNGEATISQTLEGDSGVGQKVNVIAGHKIMVLMDVKEVTSMYVGVFRSQYDNVGFQAATNTKIINSVGFVSFFTTIAELGNYKSYVFGFARGGVNSFINLINLTQKFGAGNEPSTYEEFLQRKPKVADEFAYNEGTIVNNKVEKVVTTGRNLFDSSTAIDGKTIIDETGIEVTNSLGWCSTFIPIIGGKSYFCKGVVINIQNNGVHFYDKDKQHINAVGIPQNGNIFVTPINAKYIRIHGRYDGSPANTAILNLSDASFNGQYAPYEKHELDLSWVKEIKDTEGVKLFEDGMKSAGTAFDEAAKGKAIKRIGVKVFDGTESWSTISNCFYAVNVGLNKAKSNNPMGKANLYTWTNKGNNI